MFAKWLIVQKETVANKINGLGDVFKKSEEVWSY
jgi:hypothetical protein